MEQAWINALIGGALIGVAVTLMLLLNGRVTGISGILYGAMVPVKGDTAWRLMFVAGLFLGGVVLHFIRPETFSGALPTKNWTVAAAGLLVGFGTILGSGCTSGHGVCGMSRFSLRSILATIAFIGAGVGAVAVFRAAGVLP